MSTKTSSQSFTFSNDIDLYVVPITVRHFICNKSAATEILEFSSLPRENSGLLVHHNLEAAQKHVATDKIKVISTHKTSTKFARLKRESKNTVFANLHRKLKHRNNSVGCAVYIIHNGVHTVFEVLPTDVQEILRKFTSHSNHTTFYSQK